MAGRGRPKREYDPTEAKLVQACSQYREPQEDTAARLGMCVETMLRLYREEWEKGKREGDLAIRKTLYDQARSGNTPALIFYCKTQLGMKETSRQEVTGENGGPVQHSIRLTLVPPPARDGSDG